MMPVWAAALLIWLVGVLFFWCLGAVNPLEDRP